MSDIQITLAAARVNAGMTQEDVAKALKVGKKTIGNWENGIVIPSFASTSALAMLYGIPLENIHLPIKST